MAKEGISFARRSKAEFADLFYQRHGYRYSPRGESPRASDDGSAGTRRAAVRRNYVLYATVLMPGPVASGEKEILQEQCLPKEGPPRLWLSRRCVLHRRHALACEPAGPCACCLSRHGNRTSERCWCKPLCRECLSPREHYCPLECGRPLCGR